jgi:hypothetical protein
MYITRLREFLDQIPGIAALRSLCGGLDGEDLSIEMVRRIKGILYTKLDLTPEAVGALQVAEAAERLKGLMSSRQKENSFRMTAAGETPESSTVLTAFDAGKGAIGIADLMTEVEARFGRERAELFAATYKLPPSPVPPPDTREALLKEVEERRRSLLEQAAEAGLSAVGVRLNSNAEIADWLRGKIKGDYFFGPVEPLWMAAQRLGVENLPAWAGEPNTGPDAVQFLDALAARLRTAGAANPAVEATAPQTDVGTGEPPAVDPFPDFIGKQRRLLLLLNGKENVRIVEAVEKLYGKDSPKNREALKAVVKRANRNLAAKTLNREIRVRGDYISLKPI